MKVPNLKEINESKVVTCIDMKDLFNSGFLMDEDYEIIEDFYHTFKDKSGELFNCHILRSNGSYHNLEFHFGFIIEKSTGSENVHIAQEIAIGFNHDDKLCFICPLSDDEKLCSKLYLRDDFPLFGSKEALNIK